MAAEWELVVWHRARLDVVMKSIVSETVSLTETQGPTRAWESYSEGTVAFSEGDIGGGAMQSVDEDFNILELEDGAAYGPFQKTVYISDPRFFQSQSKPKNLKPRLES